MMSQNCAAPCKLCISTCLTSCKTTTTTGNLLQRTCPRFPSRAVCQCLPAVTVGTVSTSQLCVQYSMDQVTCILYAVSTVQYCMAEAAHFNSTALLKVNILYLDPTRLYCSCHLGRARVHRVHLKTRATVSYSKVQ